MPAQALGPEPQDGSASGGLFQIGRGGQNRPRIGRVLVDLEDANPEKVKKQLADFNLLPEEWGGTTIFNEISALNYRLRSYQVVQSFLILLCRQLRMYTN